MTKLLFVINSLTMGGVEKALVNLVNSLDAKKYDITVLCIIKDFKLKEQLNSNIKLKGIFPKKMKGVDYLFKYIPTNILYRLFIRKKYDIEIAFSDGKPVVLLGFNTISKSKKFTWIHQDVMKYDNVINCYKSWDEYKKSYNSFNKVFCVSEQANDSFIQVTNCKNSCVMYNIIPKNELMLKAKEEIDLEFKNNLVFTIVGRLSYEKGQMRFLKIHKALLDEGFYYKLWIIGDGPDRTKIEEYIEENDLQNSVTLLGFQSNPYKYMVKSDLYICPSYTEALGNTRIESLLLGVPIITTNVPGTKEILGNSNAGVVVDNSDKSLYSGIKKILKNPEVIREFREDTTYIYKKFNDQLILGELETIWKKTI